MMVEAARKQVPPSGKLDPEEVTDERDVSPRAAADTSGKRVRAIPAKGGTEVVVRPSDFKRALDLDHPKVTWNFRRDNFTVAVGKGEGKISPEAADALTKNFPESFEYMNE
jgi:hypothetical protein